MTEQTIETGKPEKKKRKGTVCTVQVPSPAHQYHEPQLLNVVTKIKPDAPEFLPVYSKGNTHVVDLVANLPGKQQVLLAHRMTLKVDCGFTMELPAGFRASVSSNEILAGKGLIVTNPASYVDGRVAVLVTNVGKELIPIEHGKFFAQMSVERAYFFDWVLNG